MFQNRMKNLKSFYIAVVHYFNPLLALEFPLYQEGRANPLDN